MSIYSYEYFTSLSFCLRRLTALSHLTLCSSTTRSMHYLSVYRKQNKTRQLLQHQHSHVSPSQLTSCSHPQPTSATPVPSE